MTDRPILFSGPMVQALLDGRKTQTRRVLRGVGTCDQVVKDHGRGGGWHVTDSRGGWMSPVKVPHAIGGRLWVRETFACVNDYGQEAILYRANDEVVDVSDEIVEANINKFMASAWVEDQRSGVEGAWSPSIHMPRWASRLTLTVTDVRVQRVQEIGEGDAKAEGITDDWPDGPDATDDQRPYAQTFSYLWDTIHTEPGETWGDNPWVCATTFTVHRCNIDEMEDAA